METQLQIHQLKTRYRLSPCTRDSRQRLDGILREVMQQALDRALEEIGVAADEELCIRRIDSQVSLQLRDSDQSLAEQWSRAIVEQIRQALERHGSRDVLRYRSRLHALTDFATGVAYHRLQRAWAWRQMGLVDDEQELTLGYAAQHLVEALLAQPRQIMPLLTTLADDGRLLALLPRLPAAHWQRLSEALSGILMPRIPADRAPTTMSNATDVDSVEMQNIKQSITESRIAALLLEHPGRCVESQAPLAALTVFIAAEIEPAMFLAAPGALIPRLQGLARTLVFARPELESLAGEWLRDAPATAGANTSAESTEASATTDDKTYQQNHADQTRQARQASLRAEAPRSETDAPPPQVSDAILNEVIPWTEPEPLETEWGGLFFLYSVMQDLDLPHSLVNDPALTTRSFAWCLYHLLDSLLPKLQDDTVQRVFAAIDLDQDLPWTHHATIDEKERVALDAHVGLFVDHLHRRLDWQDESDTMLEWICRCPARLQLDAGWLKVVLPLDTIDTGIRRAMLDLNPGFLPWLGRVVEFVYE